MSNLIEYEDATDAGRTKGMNDAIFGELMAIVATANATNRLANGYQIPVDEQFKLQHFPGK